MSKLGWVDETQRVPPDNREVAAWSYYGPATLEGYPVKAYIDNLICKLYEYRDRCFAVHAVGPRPNDGTRPLGGSLDLCNTDLDTAKAKAEKFLREDLGWVLASEPTA